jgi:hypothetical protein
MIMTRGGWIVLAVMLSSTAMALDLTGDWKAKLGTEVMAGPDFYIRQIGDSVWMYGEDWSGDPTWTSVANGTIKGNTVEFSWADVPKGNATLYGTLLLNITTDNELKVLNQTGGWGGEMWDQMSLIRSAGFEGTTGEVDRYMFRRR